MATYNICALPADWWERSGDATKQPADIQLIKNLMREAQGLWRRIHKGVNAETERGRYCICLEELEGHLATRLTPVTNFEMAVADADQIAAIALDGRYFDFLARHYLEQNERRQLGGDLRIEPAKNAIIPPGLGASIFPPDAVELHIAEVEERLSEDTELPAGVREAVLIRQELLRQIATQKAGVIEIGEPLDNLEPHSPPPRSARYQAPGATASTVDAAPDGPPGTGRHKSMEVRLRQAVEAALPVGGQINMSRQPHEVVTEILAEFVTRADGTEPGVIRVVYVDGLEARPFPLRCLPPIIAREPDVTLSAALMSMRHLEIDSLVDFAWFRNREVSQPRSQADTDAFCFEFSQKQFAELRAAYHGKHMALHLYHTGFEPAVIGFYRALVMALQEDRWITVVPHYFRGEEGFSPSRREWR